MKLFDKVAIKRPKYSKFDLSHEKKFSTNMGKLTPIYLEEIIPGDHFKVNTEMLIRLAPMKFPVMHRMNAFIHYWFVPNRLVFNQWEDFITGGDDGLAAPVFPYISMQDASTRGANKGEIWDYFGLPPLSTMPAEQKINALPFRAYQLVWNEGYRDQNLADKLGISKEPGIETQANVTQNLTTRYRSWEHDYFTSCLPQAQKGGEVLLPMEADINYSARSVFRSEGLVSSGNSNLEVNMDGVSQDGLLRMNSVPVQFGQIRNIDSIENATTTINDLRKAVRLQEWLEKSMRAGSRYAESIRAFFGIISSDARLQRPEYLGGGMQPIIISEVLQTYEGTDPLGKMGGHGISVGSQNGFSRKFEEHGYVIGLMSILPKSSYYQGIPKTFFKSNKFDFPFPEFAHLGEQEVLNKEVYYDATDTTNAWNELAFGYIPRYSEYKFHNSQVNGEFRDSMANWTMVRKFENRPALNEEFVEARDCSQDIFNVIDPNEDKFFVNMYHSISAIRALPYFGTPTL
ncbi:MAG: major capsid protein [Microvirus sp.]|nr:MAG: major capsid protein [Microvirus sp.]